MSRIPYNAPVKTLRDIIGKISDEELRKSYEEYVMYKLKVYKNGEECDPCVMLDDIKSFMKWTKENIVNCGYHRGQLKLLLSEIQFLTDFADSNNSKPCIAVYAGAAAGMKNYLLHCLFPKVKFILVDPAEFRINIFGTSKSGKQWKRIHYNGGWQSNVCYVSSAEPNIPPGKYADYYPDVLPENVSEFRDFVIGNEEYDMFIINGCFTTELAEQLGAAFRDTNLLFINDVRTGLSGKYTGLSYKSVSEGDIIWACVQNMLWLNKLGPRAALLKNRLPWVSDPSLIAIIKKLVEEVESVSKDLEECKIVHNLDFIQNAENGVFEYLDGKVYIQAFPARGSTETRLLVVRQDGDVPYPVKIWDTKTYDEKLQYYNAIERQFGNYKNKYKNNDPYMMEVCHCADCALMIHILEGYVESSENDGRDVWDILADIKQSINPRLVSKQGLSDFHTAKLCPATFVKQHNAALQLLHGCPSE